MANWIRVGYCQGHFNSDNCAAGGCTLDYGPFGFIEGFDPYYQPWTGGGEHFAFFNQSVAAERNFEMFCTALRPLVESHPAYVQQLDEIRSGFANVMQAQMEKMLAAKQGLATFNAALFSELFTRMMQTSIDYTIFFRELSSILEDIGPLKKRFYRELDEELDKRWSGWLTEWKSLLAQTPRTLEDISEQMKRVNPKYSLREWLLAPAYQQAARGNYALIRELQEDMTQPYAEQPQAVEEKYYRPKPSEYSDLGGVSHMSCSS